MYLLRPIQTAHEIGGGCPGEEVTVGVVSVGQDHDVRTRAGMEEALGQNAGCTLAGTIGILIEGNIDVAAAGIGQLGKLERSEMRAEGAGGIAKAGLPQPGEVE